MFYLRNALVIVAVVLIGAALVIKYASPDRCDLCDDYIGYERATQQPHVLYRPPVRYTEAARKHAVRGVVRLNVGVDADGSVSSVKPIATLPYGLTDEAIGSARQTWFYPARDSKNFMVPGDITLEYSFP